MAPSKKKKVGKERLDKYYHLAKSQGYRARSAFKLIQLNKKYGFLNNARVAIDLCAAPGGWLQVCSKYMPMSSVIIGVDLVKIKPIPNVITHAEDITSDRCRTLLKKDLKDWKADVVMNDGAPNVGTAWLQDAFTQSELVLAALKLAVEFLAPGGTFVTKIFRSKDYNNLMFVFNQLFKRVEATKPPSSRNVSAEIFVVCRDYLAPKKIDPRFLDAKHVFKDLDLDGEGKEVSAGLAKVSMQRIINPEKAAKLRHRDGYKDGDYTLHAKHSILDFIECRSDNDATVMLASANQFAFDSRESSLDDDQAKLKMISQHSSTDAELMECLKDLKVLGRKEYKNILKWRRNMRNIIGNEEKPVSDDDPATPGSQQQFNETTEIEQLELMAEEASKVDKRAERKRRLKMAKERRRQQLNMLTPTDIATDNINSNELFDDEIFVGKDGKIPVEVEDDGASYSEQETEESVDSSNEMSEVDSDLEKELYLEQQVDGMYNAYIERKLEKDAKLKVKEMRANEPEFKGAFSDDDESEKSEQSAQEDTDSEGFSDSESEIEGEPEQENENSNLWFKNPVFDGVDFNSDEESDGNNRPTKKVVNKKRQREQEDDNQDQNEKESSDSDVEYTNDPREILSSAEAVDMALKMVQDGGRMRREMMDNRGYNRYVFNDGPDDLPKWFTTDENKHNKPQNPISKEAVQLLRQRQKEIDARPIKKVMEAKARKKYKTSKKLEGLRKKMNDMMDEDVEDGQVDLESTAKLNQIDKTMRRALMKAKKSEKKKAKLVVARGGNKAQQGRPRGVKGRYKMVDSRLKKDARAAKRVEKKRK